MYEYIKIIIINSFVTFSFLNGSIILGSIFINNDFNVFIQKAIDLEKEKDKFSMNTKLKINNTIKDVKITVQVIYDGEEVLGILGDIEIL